MQIMNSNLSEFINIFRKLEKRFLELKDQGNLSININNVTKEIKARVSPDSREYSQFLSVLYVFVNDESSLNYRKILDLIQKNYIDKINKKEIELILDEIKQNDRFKIIKVGGEYLPGKYFIELFNSYNSDTTANRTDEIVELIKKPVVSQIVWFEFYSYTMNLFCILSKISGLVHIIQKSFESVDIPKTPCIICKSIDNDFKSREHIFPESLGNTGLILEPGFVCDICNNGLLSELDEELLKFSPVAFLKVYYSPFTKNGKSPSANFQNMKMIKTRSRRIDIIAKDKSAKIKKEKVAGDIYKVRTTFRGGTFNNVSISRSLHKIAYETLTLERGKDFVLNARYDNTREFIKNKIKPYNNLFFSTNISPQNILQCIFNINDKGTIFIVNIYGLLFMLNLENDPTLLINDELKGYGYNYFYKM
ncbi:MAG: HNH endonuclease [Melioribacteraceae bacterium]|nr:HNH endonuclease [Melioribacteraceae bacterium]